MNKYVAKNNLAFTTVKCRGLLEVGVVTDKFGATLFEIIHTTTQGDMHCLYFENFSSVTDYIKTNFTYGKR